MSMEKTRFANSADMRTAEWDDWVPQSVKDMDMLWENRKPLSFPKDPEAEAAWERRVRDDEAAREVYWETLAKAGKKLEAVLTTAAARHGWKLHVLTNSSVSFDIGWAMGVFKSQTRAEQKAYAAQAMKIGRGLVNKALATAGGGIFKPSSKRSYFSELKLNVPFEVALPSPKFANSTDMRTAVDKTVIVVKAIPVTKETYQFRAEGSFRGTPFEAVTTNVYIGLDRINEPGYVSQVLRHINDGTGRKMPPGFRRDVEKALLSKMLEVEAQVLKGNRRTAAPRGKAQLAIMKAIQNWPQGHVENLADIASSSRGFLGIHFGDVMSAARALAKQGLITYNNGEITKSAGRVASKVVTGRTRPDPEKMSPEDATDMADDIAAEVGRKAKEALEYARGEILEQQDLMKQIDRAWDRWAWDDLARLNLISNDDLKFVKTVRALYEW
jgi:hypothetical protein